MTAAEFLAESKRIEGLALRHNGHPDEWDDRAWGAVLLLPRMREALEAVLDEHSPSASTLNLSAGEVAAGVSWCSGCGNRSWPCATVRAIESALAENGEKK